MKVGVGGRIDFCFTITERRNLVVCLFHVLVQPPHNDIWDTKFLGCTHMCLGPSIDQNGLC